MTWMRPSVRELVLMMAGLMSVNALAIDIMLPALPELGQALGVDGPNHRQYVVVGFVAAVGFGQLIWGPLSDRFGRRPVLLGCIAGYIVAGAACAILGRFEQLVGFRAVQGFFAAGPRVVAISIVRDLHRGPRMAQVMSWILMTFMTVSIVAPGIGWMILRVAGWRPIFGSLVIFGVLLEAWVRARLPETVDPSARRSVRVGPLFRSYFEVVRNPVSRGYALAVGLVFGILFGFIGSSEQLFAAFGRAETFPLYFAGVASAMAAASVVNARWVDRLGPRRTERGRLFGPSSP